MSTIAELVRGRVKDIMDSLIQDDPISRQEVEAGAARAEARGNAVRARTREVEATIAQRIR